MLEKGAAADRARDNGATPLLLACLQGHVDVARLLLEKGADVNRAMVGTTPLDIAKSKGHEALVALLEEHMSSKSRDAAES